MAYIHLKPYFKLALHEEDAGDDPHSTEHHPHHQLGCGEVADTRP